MGLGFFRITDKSAVYGYGHIILNAVFCALVDCHRGKIIGVGFADYCTDNRPHFGVGTDFIRQIFILG
jgi:hypothetical protein